MLMYGFEKYCNIAKYCMEYSQNSYIYLSKLESYFYKCRSDLVLPSRPPFLTYWSLGILISHTLGKLIVDFLVTGKQYFLYNCNVSPNSEKGK